MKRLEIEQEKKDDKKKKGHTFSVDLQYYLKSDALWEGGSAKSDNIRPVFIMVGGTESEVRSFTANFKGGRLAELKDTENRYASGSRFQLLKSATYHEIIQRVDLGGEMSERYVISTIYLVELFALDPGMIDEEVRFISLPPMWWVDEELARLSQKPELVEGVISHVRTLGFGTHKDKTGGPILSDEEIIQRIPLASHFVSYLEKRTPRPLVCALEFYLQIYLFALREQLALVSEASDFTAQPGRMLAPAVICQTSQDVLDEFLARQAKLYFTTKAEPSRLGEFINDEMELVASEISLLEFAVAS